MCIPVATCDILQHTLLSHHNILTFTFSQQFKSYETNKMANNYSLQEGSRYMTGYVLHGYSTHSFVNVYPKYNLSLSRYFLIFNCHLCKEKYVSLWSAVMHISKLFNLPICQYSTYILYLQLNRKQVFEEIQRDSEQDIGTFKKLTNDNMNT
jgi:hypothetical protein